MTRALPVDLAGLVDDVRAAVSASAPEPRFARDEGEHRATWLAEVAATRAAHDAAARAVRHALVDAQRARFGVDARDLLGLQTVSPVRRAWPVQVPDGGMRALVPGAVASVGASAGGCDVAATVAGTGSGASPAIVRLHGGAFWMGGGDVRHAFERDLVDLLVERLGAVVVDLDHRLAPEHPLPAGIEDALAAVGAVRAAASDLGVDPARVALVGTSSGGSIALAAAMLDAWRRPTHPIAALACVVPSFDLASLAPSMRDDDDAAAARQRMLRGYLGDHDASSAWAAPARVHALVGAPPTFVAWAEHDEVAVGGADACAAIVRGGGIAEARGYAMTHTIATPDVEASVARDVVAFLAERLQVAPVA